MKRQMTWVMAAALVMSGASVQAQAQAKAPAKKHGAAGRRSTVEAGMAEEIELLKQRQAAQQAQIDALTAAIAARDTALTQSQQAVATAQQQAQTANSQAEAVAATVQTSTEAVKALETNVADLQTINTGLAQTISTNKQELHEEIESPAAVHYKGVTITPSGFFALEGVWRQRAINADINTPLGGTPFNGATDAHTTELNFSARHTRLGGLLEGNAGMFKLAGYVESDFLSAATTSNNNQSGSYSLRLRQAWARAETKNGFALTGGQTWSLLTETGRSTDVRTEKTPNTVDPAYLVGYTWLRQPGIRLQKKFVGENPANLYTIAVAAEQAQIIFAGTTNAPNNFDLGGPGQAPGLYNPTANYASNLAPDVIAKMTADTKYLHFELGGIARFFRARVYPGVGNAATGYVAGSNGTVPYNDMKLGGGVQAGLRVAVSKYLDVAMVGMTGDGIGRYGGSQLSDVTIHPNGTLAPIRGSHGLFSFEAHPSPKLDVYAYYGGEYAQRTVYATGVAASPFTGYGAISTSQAGCNTEVAPTAGGFTESTLPAGPCGLDTRYIQEGMVGFTYKAYNSQKLGRLQYQATYSYLTRSLWTGFTAGNAANITATGGPKAVNNMVHVSLRYYIP